MSWFLDLNEKGQLDLNPPYQRRSVWTPKDRRFFVDTILNNYPAPPVFLHKTLNDQGKPTYHVVDGKQRLQTIIDFASNKIRIPDEFSDSSLRKKKWAELDRETRERFWNYVLIVEMLPSVSDAVIRDTFERINRNSRKLERQEIRHAKYEGWLIAAAESEAEKEEWKLLGIVTPARAKRMADVQFISELFAVVIKKDIFGFDQDWLDELYAEYEEPEPIPSFVEEDFWRQTEFAKKAILSIVTLKPETAQPLKKLANFYSLWSLLVLQTTERLEVQALADEYSRFITAVDEELRTPWGSNDTDFKRAVVSYAANAGGATTDASLRNARHESLILALGQVPGMKNENR